MEFVILSALAVAALVLFTAGFFAKQYKRCSSDEVLVIYGKVRGGKTAECVHGGGKLVWPLIQDYKYLSLRPIPVDIPLKGALSKGNIRVNVPTTFTIAVSRDPAILINAAERLLNLTQAQVVEQAKEIILGHLRSVIANMKIEDINSNRDEFLHNVNTNVGTELHKIGLELINVNIQDLTDDSGYLAAIGKKVASEAIQQAYIDVAEQEKKGAAGVAQATKERDISVAAQNSESAIGKAEAERNQRVKTAELSAQVTEGENLSKAKMAISNATLQEGQADALRRGEVAKAKADRDVLVAQKEATIARFEKDQLAQQEVEKKKVEIDAEAHAEQTRRVAKGDADAILMKYTAEAQGIQKVLEAKAQGYKKLAEAAGSSQGVANLLMIEKLDSVVKAQAEMVANIKIDKITVWDSGNNETSNFVQQFGKLLPPLQEVTKAAGLQLPEFMGTTLADMPTPPANGGKSGANGYTNGKA